MPMLQPWLLVWACLATSLRGQVTTYSAVDVGVDVLGQSILQRESGELLVAGSALLTFDGHTWKRGEIPTSYSIRGLDFGPDRKLWAAASNELGWFENDLGGEWRFHSLLSKLRAIGVTGGGHMSVYADIAGVTFVSLDAVIRWDGEDFKVWPMPGEKRLFSSRAAGVVFVHREERGLFVVNPTGPELLIPRERLPEAGILWVGYRDDHWLLCTSEGFFQWRNGELAPSHPELAAFLQANRLITCVDLPNGGMAVCSMKGGLVLIDSSGRIDRRLSSKEELPSDFVAGAFVDREGALWVISGLHVVRIGLVTTTKVFGAADGIERASYRSIAKFGGHVAVATDTQVFVRPPFGGKFTLIPELSNWTISMRADGDGLLAAGLRALARWDGDAVVKLHEPKIDVFYAAPRRSRLGHYVASVARDLVDVSVTEGPQVIARSLPGVATSIAEDETGRLWLGTFGHGLHTLGPTPGEPASSEPANSAGLPPLQGKIHARAARDGSILVVADGGAWVRAAGTERFVAVRGFPSRNAAAVSEAAPDGATFWVALADTVTRAQVVGRVTLGTSDATWTPHAVEALDSIGRVQCLLADLDEQRRTVLWLGGTRSVMSHTITGALSVPKPPRPVLRVYARGHGETTRRFAPASLPYDTHAVEAEFAVPQFGRRAALRLESKIDGMGEDWQPVGPGSRRELTGLRDGRYSLRVRAVSEIGEAGPEAAFAFRVLAPWWRSGWFLGAVAAALVPAGYGAYWLRVRALHRRNAVLEARVRARTEELELANAAKTEFVANMSHDIRNPLGGIVGLTYALEQSGLDPRQQELVATMRKCSLYLSTLVDDVLDFASIEAGQILLRPTAFEPSRLLVSVVETMRATAKAQGADLTTTVAPNVPALLEGDVGRIQQILVNYTANAIKYAGGAIEIAAAVPAGAPGELEFSVIDRGPGIAAADQAKLFAKFTRLHAPHSGEVRGHGLGLAACRLLAERMGGSVGVESSPGAGARFRLRLPLKLAVAPVEVPVASLAAASALVVEDEDCNAWAAAAVLKQLGIGSDRARTGAEALEKFAAGRYAMVLLDRNLPDMDGLEIAKRMRQLETENAPALLIAVTAYCTAQDREQCLANGMDDFVGKPLTPEKLRRVFAVQADRLRPAAPAEAVFPARVEELDFSLLAQAAGHAGEETTGQLERVIHGMKGYQREIDEASARQDFRGLGLAAHRLLGQALLIGGATLADAARRLEDAADAMDADACAAWLRRVRAETAALMAAVGHRRPTSTIG